MENMDLESEEEDLQEAVWAMKKDRVMHLDRVLKESFWPQIHSEIRNIKPSTEDFSSQAIPMTLTQSLLLAEAKHLSNAAEIDSSASCALSKLCELFVLELTVSALYSKADQSNTWKIKKEDIAEAITSSEHFDLILDHAS